MSVMYGHWPKSVGGVLVLYPDENGYLYTDDENKNLANRREVEKAFPMVAVATDDYLCAAVCILPRADEDDEVKLYAFAGPATTETVDQAEVTTIPYTEYTVDETYVAS